jgi:hypothetical protein
MKFKYIITANLFVYMIVLSCKTSIFKSISKEVDNVYLKKSIISNPSLKYHEVRFKAYKENRLTFFESKKDTVYFVEQFNIEENSYFGAMWNNSSIVKYEYYNDSFNYDTAPFTRYTLMLIKRWDTIGIRHEEQINSNMLPSRNIYATRIIKLDKNITIDTIVFKKFFNLVRDRTVN